MLLSGLGLLGTLAVGWSVFRAPAVAVALVVASVPLQGFAVVGVGDGAITWTQAWLWTYLAVAATLFAARLIAVRVDLATLSFGIVVVCYIHSLRFMTDEVAWRNEVYRWAVTLAFFVSTRALVGKRPFGGALVGVAVLGAVWTTVVAVIQMVLDVGPTSFERAGRMRAYSAFGEPNTYGAFAAGSLVVLVACPLFARPPQPRWWRPGIAAGAAFSGAGLLLSQSRGALAATVVVLGAMIALKLNGSGCVSRPARLTAVAAVTVAVILAAPRVSARLARSGAVVEVTSASWADQERLAHWGAASRMIVASDGIGVGAGQFDSRYREVTPTWRYRISQGHAHNAYLQVAAEAGLLGLGAYVALLTAVLVSLARRLARDGPSVGIVSACAATGVFALHNLVDYLHVLNLPIILVAWWAVALGQSKGPAKTP